MKDTKHRHARRTNLRVAVKVEHKSRLQEFYSRNLSSGGIFLEVEKKLPAIGSKLKLKFEVPGLRKAIMAEAEVLHHHSYETMNEKMEAFTRKGMGLRFLNLSEQDEALINEYITGKELHVSS